MESMSARFKAFGLKHHKKNNNNSARPASNTTTNINPLAVTLSNNTSQPGSPPSDHPTESTTSLPMNNQQQQQQLGRPPSYTVARPTSPMPPGQQQLSHHPAPINNNLQYGQATVQTMNAPPGYGMQQPGMTHPIPPNISQQYPGRGAAEVEGGGRGKAQLIVGIDFGTTFSGVAFAFATNNEAREDIITEWPGAGTHTKQKVSACRHCHTFPC